jgi:molecular chaperone DnaK
MVATPKPTARKTSVPRAGAARNQADGLIHATRSAIKDNGDKVPGDLIGRAEGAIAELETAMKGDDKGQIDAKPRRWKKPGRRCLPRRLRPRGQPVAAMPGRPRRAGCNDDVVDAEFTEVKDDKK